MDLRHWEERNMRELSGWWNTSYPYWDVCYPRACIFQQSHSCKITICIISSHVGYNLSMVNRLDSASWENFQLQTKKSNILVSLPSKKGGNGTANPFFFLPGYNLMSEIVLWKIESFLGKNTGFWTRQSWMWLLTLLFAGWVTLGKPLSLSFAISKNGTKTLKGRVFWEFNEVNPLPATT